MRIFSGQRQHRKDVVWAYPQPEQNPYRLEWMDLVDAIINDKPYNETERSAYAAMAGILGRMAAESGKLVTWEQAMASDLELAPGLEQKTWDSEAPVKPDENGQYTVAMPGISKAF